MNRMELRKKQVVIISSIIGLLTMIVLTNIISDLGITYFAAAMEVYILMQLLFTATLPDMVAKFVRTRMAKGQYKNADVVLKAAVGYGVIIGLVGSLILTALSGFIAERMFGIKEITRVLRFLAPAFFLNAIASVLQGYFQGIKTMVPTMISAVLKEVLNLVFAVIFGLSLYKYGQKVSALLHNDKFSAFYGAEGAAIGVLIATFCMLGFLVFLYFLVGRRFRGNHQEGMRRTEDALELIKLLIVAMAPVALLQFLMRVDVLAGLLLFARSQHGSVDGLAAYGAYYGEFLAIAGVLAAFGVLVTCSIEGHVIQSYKKEEYKNARDFLQKGMQAQFLVSAFLAGLFLAIAPSLFKVLFGNADVAVNCMSHGFLLIVFIPMGIYFSRILVGIGKTKLVLLMALGSAVISFVLMLILQKALNGSVLMLVYGELAFSVIFCISTGVVLLKTIHCNPEWLRVFVLPALASCIMALGIVLIRKAIDTLVGDFVTTLIALIAGSFCHFVLIIVFRCIRKKDLYMMPGGKLLEKLESHLHIF